MVCEGGKEAIPAESFCNEVGSKSCNCRAAKLRAIALQLIITRLSTINPFCPKCRAKRNRSRRSSVAEETSPSNKCKRARTPKTWPILSPFVRWVNGFSGHTETFTPHSHSGCLTPCAIKRRLASHFARNFLAAFTSSGCLKLTSFFSSSIISGIAANA